jgi:hypothetical protein
MPSTSRPQQRYDHRLRDLVQRTGDLTIATELGVPRSTALGWLLASPTVVVRLEVANLAEPELRQEILKLQRRVEKLAALLRLALALLQTSGFSLSGERPDEEAKLRILRAVDQARACLPLRAVLRFLQMSPSRFQAWRRRQTACALDDPSCPRTSPHRLTLAEVHAIGDMITSPEYDVAHLDAIGGRSNVPLHNRAHANYACATTQRAWRHADRGFKLADLLCGRHTPADSRAPSHPAGSTSRV